MVKKIKFGGNVMISILARYAGMVAIATTLSLVGTRPINIMLIF